MKEPKPFLCFACITYTGNVSSRFIADQFCLSFLVAQPILGSLPKSGNEEQKSHVLATIHIIRLNLPYDVHARGQKSGVLKHGWDHVGRGHTVPGCQQYCSTLVHLIPCCVRLNNPRD